MTALGKIALQRAYRVCSPCQRGEFPTDAILGLDGFLSGRARRLVCLVGIHDAFAQAERLLDELTGWTIDAETIRRTCHAEAATLNHTLQNGLETAKLFVAAAGDWELQIDAGKVNTETGWRDVKVAAFARRERAAATNALDYEQRDLPTPTIRSVRAAVETAECFGQRCRAEADRLGLPAEASLSILGDGAEWIWNLSARHFTSAEQVLDVFHAAEYLADLARVGYGESPKSSDWLTAARTALLADGWAGVCEHVARTAAEVPNRAALEAEFPRVANYLAGHQDRMPYAVRLRRGQAIGSGLIEGTIKQVLNRRLKQTGARWRSDHVGPFVELRALADGPQWDEYWSAA